MGYATSRRLLDALLGGEQLTKDTLEQAIGELKEDQYLDFKDGVLTSDENKAKRLIRRYVSAFANADGGVLIIGVSEKTKQISPCTHPGRGSLREWLASVLNPFAGLLVPPPNFHVVEPGPVLVIPVARAPRYVHVVEDGKLVYYLRFYDETLPVPEFLLSDLFLGRRQQPVIEFQVRPAAETVGARCVSFHFSIYNEGLVTAEDIEIGMICWSFGAAEPRLSSYLRSNLDIVEPKNNGWQLAHRLIKPKSASGSLRLSPFTRNSDPLTAATYVFPPTGAFRFSAAIYMLEKVSFPLWYEYESVFWVPQENSLAHPSPDDCFSDTKKRPVVGRRPRVLIADP